MKQTFEQAAVEFLFRVVTNTSVDIFAAHDAILKDAFKTVREFADRGQVPAEFESRFLAFAKEQGVFLDNAQ